MRLASALRRDLGGFRSPGHAASETISAFLQIAQEEISGGEGVFAEHQVQALRVGLLAETGERADVQASLLRKIADEEISLGELRCREHLALERVDALDLAAHHHAVRAARETNLRRNVDLELLPVNREHIDRRRGRRHLAAIERRPAFLFAQFDADLEAVLLEEHGVRARLQPAIRHNDSRVARVFAQLDINDAVLRQVSSRRGELGNLRLRLDESGGGWVRSVLARRSHALRTTAAGWCESIPPFPRAKADDAEDEQGEKYLSACSHGDCLFGRSGRWEFRHRLRRFLAAAEQHISSPLQQREDACRQHEEHFD